MKLIKEKQDLLNELRRMGIKDERVLNAIKKIKRELFIDKKFIDATYKNYPLPIGYNQTISQPYTVAFMIELLNITPGNRILEIGSGSGYNAAVISLLNGKKGIVFSMEIIKGLAKFARENLKKAGINNVKIINKDGCYGYKKEAPFDKIILTAFSPEIPFNLIAQLSEKGILVMPLAKRVSQIMIKIIKKDEKIFITNHGYFSFVPLTGNINALKRQ